MSRIAVKEFSKAPDPFAAASKEPLKLDDKELEPVRLGEGHSESDSEEEEGMVWQRGNAGAAGHGSVQQPKISLQKCMSSVRDYFTLGPIDQLLLSIVVFGASGDLGKPREV